MRDTDIELAEYMGTTYGPFKLSVIENRKKHKCDFCQDLPKRIARAEAARNTPEKPGKYGITGLATTTPPEPPKSLYVCLENVCLDNLIGESEAKQARFAAMVQAGGGTFVPSDNLDEIEAKEEGDRVQKLVNDSTSKEELRNLMDRAWALHQKGLGAGWRIMPNLFEQYAERGTLSTKQEQVVRRYLRTCESEALAIKNIIE